MTFDSWCSQIARPIIQIHNWAWIYFVSFGLISAFVIMNVIVGIVVDPIEEARENTRKKKRESNILLLRIYQNR